MSRPESSPSQKSRKSRIQDGELNDRLIATPHAISHLFRVSVPITERGSQTLMREDMSPNGVIPEVLIARTQLASLFPAIKATVLSQLVTVVFPFSRRAPVELRDGVIPCYVKLTSSLLSRLGDERGVVGYAVAHVHLP